MTLRPLTAAERALLAAAHRHLRTHGWTMTWGGLTNQDRRLCIDWDGVDTDAQTRRIELHQITAAGYKVGWAPLVAVDVVNARQALDVLTAFGVLPVEFSTGYSQGLVDAGNTAASALRTIPGDFLLALLRQANSEDDLDVADDELLRHYRTAGYRAVIQACWIAAQAAALGWQVEVGDLGDRLLILDRISPEA